MESGQKSRKNRRRLYILVFILSGILFTGLNSTYLQAAASREVIRVGFFSFDGYHMMDKNGNRSGYGYDFLRLAARYMDVDYKYIGYDKSWDEMQKMLEHNKIDLLTSVQKTEEREKKFDFSKPIGVSSAMLTVKSSNNSILEQEYDTYENMKVGMLRNNSRNNDFQKFAKEKGFSYQPVYYDMESELKEALQKGKVDAALTSSLRSIHDERILEEFATRTFYAVVKKGNTQVLNKINYAIDQMNLAEGDWKSELNYQYYGQTEAKTLVFSEKEKADSNL